MRYSGVTPLSDTRAGDALLLSGSHQKGRRNAMKIPTSSSILRALSPPPQWKRRLAAAVAVVGVFLASCDVHTPAGPGALTTITVTPDTTLQINATKQFVAAGADAEGAVVDVT